MENQVAPSAPPPKYDPPQNELNYYNELFAQADQSQTGTIDGRSAVTFLSRSKLPVDLLKNIWNMADYPKTNTLDKPKFFTAIRLIQLYQNGKSATGPGLQADAMMRAPFFEGVTGVSAQPFDAAPTPASPPQSPRRGSQLSTASGVGYIASPQSPGNNNMPPPPVADSDPVASTSLTQDPYIMLPGEQVRYESLFPQYAQEDYVYGAQAVELFTKSGLSKEVLRDVWNLVDNPVDNRLDRLEFAMAMHLIVCVSKKSLPLPPSLPPSMKALKERQASSAGIAPPPVPVAAPVQTAPIAAAPTEFPSPGIQQSFSGGGSVSAPAPTMPNMGMSINLGMATASISDAFDGMQVQPPAPSLQPTLSTDSVPQPIQSQVVKDTNSTTFSSNSQPELEKVRAVLQKLQAENVSLKAQLGQYSEEEQSIRGEISKTVNEIGSLSQELSALRSQVVNAKSNLIEASVELKSQMEKRDFLKSLIIETQELKEALDVGVHTVHSAEESVKNSNSRRPSLVEPPVVAPATDYTAQNPFGDAMSVLTDNQVYAAARPEQSVSNPYYSQGLPGGVAQTPQRYSATSAAAPQQQPQQQQSNGPSSDEIDRLNQMKMAAQQAENDATSAADHVQALEIQYGDLRDEADRAASLAHEKQNSKPKKKSLFKSKNGKKEYQKELDAAIADATSKGHTAKEAQQNLRNAKDNAQRMQQEAEQKRRDTDNYEMELANRLTSVVDYSQQNSYQPPTSYHPPQYDASSHSYQPPQPTQGYQPQPTPDEFGAPPSYNPYAPTYGQQPDPNQPYNPYAAPSSPGPTPMGMGGYCATPARPEQPHSQPQPQQNLMGGNINDGLGGAHSINNNSNVPSTNALFTNESNIATPTTTHKTQKEEDDLLAVTGSSVYEDYSKNEASQQEFQQPTHEPAQQPKYNFPTDGSESEASNAGLSYATNNTGVSYGSVPVSTTGNEGQNTNQNDGQSVADISYDGGSYVSIPETTVQTIPAVAPLPVQQGQSNHDYGTDSSIQGSVSRAGTISGYNSVANGNPDDFTTTSQQGSVSYAGSISVHDSDNNLAAATNSTIIETGSTYPIADNILQQPQYQNTGSNAFDGIPSPHKDVSFDQISNGGSIGIAYQSAPVPSMNMSHQTNSFEGGIPTPTVSNDSTFFSETTLPQPTVQASHPYPSQQSSLSANSMGSYSAGLQSGNVSQSASLDGSAIPPSNSNDQEFFSEVQPQPVPIQNNTTSHNYDDPNVTAATEMMSNANITENFSGIPSPPKNEIDDEYANPFALS